MLKWTMTFMQNCVTCKCNFCSFFFLGKTNYHFVYQKCVELHAAQSHLKKKRKENLENIIFFVLVDRDIIKSLVWHVT